MYRSTDKAQQWRTLSWPRPKEGCTLHLCQLQYSIKGQIAMQLLVLMWCKDNGSYPNLFLAIIDPEGITRTLFIPLYLKTQRNKVDNRMEQPQVPKQDYLQDWCGIVSGDIQKKEKKKKKSTLFSITRVKVCTLGTYTPGLSLLCLCRDLGSGGNLWVRSGENVLSDWWRWDMASERCSTGLHAVSRLSQAPIPRHRQYPSVSPGHCIACHFLILSYTVSFHTNRELFWNWKEMFLEDMKFTFGVRIAFLIFNSKSLFSFKQVTWADFYWDICSTTLLVLKPDLLDIHPRLASLRKKVQALPAIAAWVQKRPQTKLWCRHSTRWGRHLPARWSIPFLTTTKLCCILLAMILFVVSVGI